MAFKITGPLAEVMERQKKESPALLQDEVALCRAILETAANEGNWGLCVACLNVLQRLSSGHVSNALRMHHLLEMSAVQKIAGRMGAVLTRHLQNQPNFEVLTDGIIRDLEVVIADAREGRFEDTLDAESREVPAIENTSPVRTLGRAS
jgi:hypothetical protein